jgi:peptidoglycan hydrolase-like protein with peptidoglycan-binding domain
VVWEVPYEDHGDAVEKVTGVRKMRMSTEPVLRQGAQGEAVKRLQRTVANLGYDPGPVDGIFGRQTEEALRQFQAANALVVDGIAGRETWAALGESGARVVSDVPQRGRR